MAREGKQAGETCMKLSNMHQMFILHKSFAGVYSIPSLHSLNSASTQYQPAVAAMGMLFSVLFVMHMDTKAVWREKLR